MAKDNPNRYTFNRLSVDEKLNVLAEAVFGNHAEWDSVGDDGKPKEKKTQSGGNR